MRRRTAATPILPLLAVLALVIAACSGAGASSAPSGEPGASADPSGSARPSFELVGPVTTPEDAWAAVVAVEPRFAGIQPLDPEMIGQSAWYEVTPASGVGAYLVTITVGWGDCQAGCIEKHTWTYAVAPDGTATLQSEDGNPVPPDAIPASGGGADGY